MTRTRTRKALYLGLPIFLILVGGGLLAWKTFGPSEAGYPRKVMKHAEELHERILSFDSRITIPPDFGTEGNEFDKDGPNQLDLVKAGRGRLSGAALAIFGWPEMWNGPNAPHKPTPGFVDEARHQQEIRYKILTGMVRDYPNQVGIAYSPRTSAAWPWKASSPSS